MNPGPGARMGLLRFNSTSQDSSTGQVDHTYLGSRQHDFELRPRPDENQFSSSHGLIRPQKRARTDMIILKMMTFYLIAMGFMGLHLLFFIWLHEKPVEDSINQELQSAVANILAIFVETFLLGGVGIAYDQIIWRIFRQKSLKVDMIDRLVTFAANPWDSLCPSVLWRVPGIWFIGLLCALLPVAAVFPPGALTVEFDDVVSKRLSNVRTMNISDYGNGTIPSFIVHSLYEMNGDLDSMNAIWPRLLSIANQVLTSGEPVKFDSPCGSSCIYNISLEGPRFNCKELGPEAALLTNDWCPMYMAKDRSRRGNYEFLNNSFLMSWLPSPSAGSALYKCNETVKTLDCSISLATYKLQIRNSLNASRTITTTLENERDFWKQGSAIQSRFYYYFYDGMTISNPPTNQHDLHTNFTGLQAFAIRSAAVKALEGHVYLFSDGGLEGGMSYWFEGNGTKVVGSPYIGLHDRYNPSFDISAENITRYLQDVVISTLSLGISTNSDDIEAKVGENVYLFNSKMQFFVPYGACLFVVACIYIQGLWSLHANRSSAGNSFLQFATTTSTGSTLRTMAAECSAGGGENVSENLKNLRLRFGVLLGASDATPVYGFGTENETK